MGVAKGLTGRSRDTGLVDESFDVLETPVEIGEPGHHVESALRFDVRGTNLVECAGERGDTLAQAVTQALVVLRTGPFEDAEGSPPGDAGSGESDETEFENEAGESVDCGDAREVDC